MFVLQNEVVLWNDKLQLSLIRGWISADFRGLNLFFGLFDELGVFFVVIFVLTTECVWEWANNEVRFVIRVS